MTPAPALVHRHPSPFPRPSTGGGQIVDEKCTCRHRRSRHQDTSGYGTGACCASQGKGLCRCRHFTRADNIYQSTHQPSRLTSARRLRQRASATLHTGGMRVIDILRDEHNHLVTAVVEMRQPQSTTKGTGLGLGVDPAYAIAQRINASLDPTRASSVPKTLADMTPAERDQLAATYGAPIVPAPPPTPPTPRQPNAADLQGIRLGPVFDYHQILRSGEKRVVPARYLFATGIHWRRALTYTGHRLRAERALGVYAYPLLGDQITQALAWGIREANRIEQAIALKALT